MSTNIDVEQILLPAEGFSASDVHIAGVDLFGIQTIRFIYRGDRQDWLELTTGYAHTADYPNGSVSFEIPSRDTIGNSAKMYLTIPRVEDWVLLIEPGSYHKAWKFTYRGVITAPQGSLSIVYVNDPAQTHYNISTKAELWGGRN